MDDLLDRALSRVATAQTVRAKGRVTELVGLVLKAVIPGVRVGDLVSVQRHDLDPLRAEVVGFRGEQVLLVPLGDPEGVGPDSVVEPLGRRLDISCGRGLIGRVLDGLGQPADGRGPLAGPLTAWPVRRVAPDPMKRPLISRPLSVGVRVLDGLCTVGEGQRVGLFAGSGVGKSTLLGQIARHSGADLNVICLVGERGREVREFVEGPLGQEGLARSVVVCATSDAPSLVRLTSAEVATAIAEFFRDQGARVLFLMDSVTRYARAQREVGLAAGEPPARRGYPPSVFAALPKLLERTGTTEAGSITALYTVLVAGGDMEEPIADEVRGILDGHIILSRELASRNHYPAVDVLASLSRVMDHVVDEDHRRAAGAFRRLLAAYEAHRDLITLGAYKAGTDSEVDRALKNLQPMMDFLRQGRNDDSDLDSARQHLIDLVG
ncbi:MAG: FliI/YscN family ATPase [Deltaproteobacteria bacterium]|nr:FliI/YscN family ATPase [Deltaproteobacteria bacterium]